MKCISSALQWVLFNRLCIESSLLLSFVKTKMKSSGFIIFCCLRINWGKVSKIAFECTLSCLRYIKVKHNVAFNARKPFRKKFISNFFYRLSLQYKIDIKNYIVQNVWHWRYSSHFKSKIKLYSIVSNISIFNFWKLWILNFNIIDDEVIIISIVLT